MQNSRNLTDGQHVQYQSKSLEVRTEKQFKGAKSLRKEEMLAHVLEWNDSEFQRTVDVPAANGIAVK